MEMVIASLGIVGVTFALARCADALGRIANALERKP